jgi:hypothetical protein
MGARVLQAQCRVLTRSTNAEAGLYFVQRAEYQKMFQTKVVNIVTFWGA